MIFQLFKPRPPVPFIPKKNLHIEFFAPSRLCGESRRTTFSPLRHKGAKNPEGFFTLMENVQAAD
jgi:hypothetical protein